MEGLAAATADVETRLQSAVASAASLPISRVFVLHVSSTGNSTNFQIAVVFDSSSSASAFAQYLLDGSSIFSDDEALSTYQSSIQVTRATHN